MKRFFLLVAFITTTLLAAAQDVIVMHDGSEVKSKVRQIGTSEVKYHKFENLDGPIYTVPRSEVFIIRYENGSKEVITKIESPTSSSPTTSQTTSVGNNKDIVSTNNANHSDSLKYAHITAAQQRTKQDIHEKKLYISPQPFLGMAVGGKDVGYYGVSAGADVFAEYFPSKKSSSGVCAGLGYNFKHYTLSISDYPINVNSLDILLGYTLRSNDMKFFGRGLLHMGIPLSSNLVVETEKADVRDITHTTFGLAIDAGFHFKKFNIGIRYSLGFLDQFDLEKNGGGVMILGLFIGGSF